MTQAIDRLDLSEPDMAQEYRALTRALRRKQGFGLFFVQASPVKGQEIFTDLRRDLPGKRIAEVTIRRTDERLFDRLEALWEKEPVNIFWIEGLEQSLLGYEDMQRLAGWDEQDLMTYSWKDVPPILSHLNLGRERFEAKFDCALVFVVPLFVVKYLLRRAGDFFDWKSGFFEFPDDRQESATQMIEDTDYAPYLKLDRAERTQKIFQIKDLLDTPEIEIDQQAKLLREIGRIFEAGGEFEQAATSHERAIQIQPDFIAAWKDRGDALRRLGRYEQALIAYERVFTLDPEDFSTYNKVGIAYKNQKNYAAAIIAYKKAIQMNPQYTYAYNNLGVLYQEQKCYEDAIYWLNKAVSLPNLFGKPETAHTLAYRNLGNVYKIQKDYASAITAYKKAIELNPQDVFAYHNLGITYAAQKDYGAAITAYTMTISLNPEYAFAYLNLGLTYHDQKQYQMAISAYQRGIKLKPQDAKAFARRGQTYKALKRYEEALKDLDRSIELDKHLSWPITCRLEVYLFSNQPERVIETEIPESYEGTWQFYIHALAHLKLNQLEPAKADLKQAIAIAQAAYEKDPIDYQNTFNLALYHLAAAHPEESDRLYTSNLTAPIEWLQMAIDDLDDFLQLFPDHPQAQQVKQMLQGAIDATQPTIL
jgi:tetratricopeptide (TPR) repeat protein